MYLGNEVELYITNAKFSCRGLRVEANKQHGQQYLLLKDKLNFYLCERMPAVNNIFFSLE